MKPASRMHVVQEKSLRWLKKWERLINATDFAGARPLFSEQVVSFGTFAEILNGLDELESEQWRVIWPTIADFTFQEPKIFCFDDASGIAGIIALWRSKCRRKDGGWYLRKGRATLILKQERGELRCIHSHLSMEPGIPPLAD